jgi:hypothetical protein
MAKIALIHGYGVGLSPQKKSLSLDLGFTAFYDGVINKDVSVFSWYQEEKHSILDFLNPHLHYQTYLKEKNAAQSNELLRQFKVFIEKEKPTTVVCHSLGAYLFLKYLEKFEEPTTIKKVVFVQADIANNTQFPNNTQDITFLNIFCPWDPALLTSWLLHKYQPAGLTGWKQPRARNKMLPLFGHWNLHASTIAQKQFAAFVASL